MGVDSTRLAQEAPSPTLPPDAAADARLLETTKAEIDIACGNHGPLCDAVLEWSGNETVAETASWVVGVPLKIIAIVLVALLVNRLARAAIRRVTLRIGQAAEQHGDMVVRERSIARAEERARTFNSLLSSGASAVIWTLALVLVADAFGISLIPVIASAERFTAVRQRWRKRNSTAEISVPACPMPIQKTKFVMSNAQPTVRLRPHVPIPTIV